MIEVLIIAGVFVLIIGFFMYASKSGAKLIAAREARMAKAENGNAKILGTTPVGLSGTGHGGRYQAYKFTLEVSSEYKSAYKTECVWEVYPIGAPKVQDGMEVKVKIDAEDPDYVYPLAEGTAFSWNWTMMHKKKK